jgi:hypothetical protein
VAGIALVIVAAVYNVGNRLNAMFTSVSNGFNCLAGKRRDKRELDESTVLVILPRLSDLAARARGIRLA